MDATGDAADLKNTTGGADTLVLLLGYVCSCGIVGVIVSMVHDVADRTHEITDDDTGTTT